MYLTEVLVQSSCLPSLGVTGYDELLRYTKLLPFQRGQRLWEEGTRSPFVGLLLSGRVKLLKRREDGRELIIDLGEPGRIIGALGTDDEPVASSVVGLAQGVVALLRKEHLEALLGEGAAEEVTACALAEMDQRQRLRAEELGHGDLETRLATVLCRLAASDGVLTAGGVLLNLPLSRQDLADLVDGTLAAVVMLMSRWDREELVVTTRNGLLIPNVARLQTRGLPLS